MSVRSFGKDGPETGADCFSFVWGQPDKGWHDFGQMRVTVNLRQQEFDTRDKGDTIKNFAHGYRTRERRLIPAVVRSRAIMRVDVCGG
jgi:hypothetical protein